MTYGTSASHGMTFFTDLKQLIANYYSYDTAETDNDRELSKYFLIHSFVNLGLSATAISCSYMGVRSVWIVPIKWLEMISREGYGFASFVDACIDYEKNPETMRQKLRFLEKGILTPLADIVRVGAELSALDELQYLELTPEEAAVAKRFIREVPEGGHFEPVNLEQCRQTLAKAHKVAEYAAAVRFVSDLAPVSTTIDLYQALSQSKDEKDLLSLNKIPDLLKDDVVFQLYRCELTGKPIRFPVGDPTVTTRSVLYEKAEIEARLAQNEISPVSGLPLKKSELVRKPAIQAAIEAKLSFHQKHLWKYIQSNDELTNALK